LGKTLLNEIQAKLFYPKDPIVLSVIIWWHIEDQGISSNKCEKFNRWFEKVSGFSPVYPHHQNWPPVYNWHIVDSGIKLRSTHYKIIIILPVRRYSFSQSNSVMHKNCRKISIHCTCMNFARYFFERQRSKD
jgi:hypothetical protein